ncbi:MAG TPA: hypothetical protein VF733_06885 [Candidatus Saccharimonadales bacterium]
MINPDRRSATGYITTDLKGNRQDMFGVNVVQALYGDDQLIGVKNIFGSSWLQNNRCPIVYPTPESCNTASWPSRLFRLTIPPGVNSIEKDGGQRVSAAFVDQEENPSLILGKQHDGLFAMAEKIIAIVQEEQYAIESRAANLGIDTAQAATRILAVANNEGRQNTKACLEMVRLANPDGWSHATIGNAVLAVAHYDLLTEKDLWNNLGSLLYAPWREVMGDDL